MNFKTVHVFPPIVIRSFDWCAFDEARDESGPYGWGKTEAEALADLKELLPGNGRICQKCQKPFDEHTQSSGFRCPGTTGSYEKNNWTP